MDKLISMTDFVLNEQRFKEDSDTSIFKVTNYANFLKQPLTLGMFVPAKLVDGVWIVLEEPIPTSIGNCINKRKRLYEAIYNEEELKEYQEAKERVLFEGFGYDEMGFAYSKTQSECGFDETYMQNKKVEDLVKYNLVLTESAKKQIGL